MASRAPESPPVFTWIAPELPGMGPETRTYLSHEEMLEELRFADRVDNTVWGDAITPKLLDEVFRLLQVAYSHVIVDLSKAYTPLDRVALEHAQAILLVTQLTLPNLRNVIRILRSFQELGVDESGVGQLIRATYHLLGLRTFFTAGEKEVRAWTIHAGDTASTAAASTISFTTTMFPR